MNSVTFWTRSTLALITISAFGAVLWAQQPVTITSGTITLPTGASTAAHQVTEHGYVDGLETLITASNVYLGEVSTDTNLLVGTIDVTADAIKVLFVDAAGATLTLASDYTVNADAPDDPSGPTLLMEVEGDWTQLRGNANGALWVACESGCSGSGASHTDDAAFTGASDDGIPIFGLYDTTPPTVTDGRAGAVRMDSSRYLYTVFPSAQAVTVSGVATAANQATVITSLDALDNAVSGAGFNITQLAGATTPMTTTQADNLALTLDALNVTAFLYMHDGTNYDMVRGSTTDGLLVNLGTNNDVTVTGSLTTVSTVTTLTQLGGVALPVEDVAETAAGVGIYAMGVRRDTLAVSAASSGDNTMSSYTATGALWSAPAAATNGGCTPNSSISTGAVLETEIKGSAGQLYYVGITNLDATNVYARLYNDTAANTDETDTPIGRFLVPTGGGFMLPVPVGAEFSAGITLRITTGAADTDTGALSANEVFVSYCYK
jgi:hypothetical protein